jgi:hypothetical protein
VDRIPAWLKYVAVAGNVVFMLWIVYNGIDSGFAGTLPERASFVGLLALLTLDSVLLLASRRANG